MLFYKPVNIALEMVWITAIYILIITIIFVTKHNNFYNVNFEFLHGKIGFTSI